MSTIRKVIARNLRASVDTAVHVSTFFEVDMTRCWQVRAAVNKELAATYGVKASFLPFIMRAAVEAIQHWPWVNAELRGTDIVVKRHVNLGVAVSINDGKDLVVPVIHNAEELNLLGLTRALTDLAERGRTKQLTADEMAGGTFSLTNPGGFGTLLGTPIIPPPQVAILGVNAIVKRPVVVTDELGSDSIAIRQIMLLALSYDHRLVDGAYAAQFLALVKHHLETWGAAEYGVYRPASRARRHALEELVASSAPAGREPSRVLRLGHAARADARGRRLDVVARAAQLHAGAEQRPERRRLALVRHADAAGVDDAAPPTSRSNCTCVWPSTTVRCATPASIGAMRAGGESAVTISSSLRGEPWQKSTSPSPSISTEASGGRLPIQSSRSRSSTPAAQCVRDDQTSAGSIRALPASSRRRASTSSRSPLPRIVSARSPSARTASTASPGNGPPATSPPTTIRSTPRPSSSASTAASAASLPWMS